MAVKSCLEKALPAADMNVSSYLKCKFLEKVAEELRPRRGGRAVEELSRQLSQFRYDIAKEITTLYSRGNVASLLSAAKKHVDEAAGALAELGYQTVVDGVYLTLTPLAIGLRNPYTEPLEISISWDPYMNLPFIPGSSLKGAVASLAYLRRSEWYKLLVGKPQESTVQPGSIAQQGEQYASPIVFLDAYPVEVLGGNLLSVDLINPHYREVEGRISEPESSPTPLRFPVVSRGVAFRIVVCATRRWLLSYKGKPSLEELKGLIGQALSRGIGAKTSLGYGRFAPGGRQLG
ncbi:MAG: type III-B CRISPR module RAMP protein Cmr6 [Thermofilum sp.]|jgi:CRISPR-associated protein Cmr6|nr:type III-B CRISPR module RAMP protein Cmr6 [Thermofilum sp.]